VVDISTAPLSAEDIGEASVHGDLLDSSECMLLTDLPPHLVHTICSYLEAKDISRLSQACKCTERATRTLRVTQMHQKMSQLRRDFTSAEERARKAEGLISRQAPVVELVTRVQTVMTQAGANGAFVFNDSVAPVHFGPNAVQLMQNNNAVFTVLPRTRTRAERFARRLLSTSVFVAIGLTGILRESSGRRRHRAYSCGPQCKEEQRKFVEESAIYSAIQVAESCGLEEDMQLNIYIPPKGQRRIARQEAGRAAVIGFHSNNMFSEIISLVGAAVDTRRE